MTTPREEPPPRPRTGPRQLAPRAGRRRPLHLPRRARGRRRAPGRPDCEMADTETSHARRDGARPARARRAHAPAQRQHPDAPLKTLARVFGNARLPAAPRHRNRRHRRLRRPGRRYRRACAGRALPRPRPRRAVPKPTGHRALASLRRRRHPARRRLRRQRRPGLEPQPVMGFAGASADASASCCSPASPACSPALPRWRRASTSR